MKKRQIYEEIIRLREEVVAVRAAVESRDGVSARAELESVRQILADVPVERTDLPGAVSVLKKMWKSQAETIRTIDTALGITFIAVSHAEDERLGRIQELRESAEALLSLRKWFDRIGQRLDVTLMKGETLRYVADSSYAIEKALDELDELRKPQPGRVRTGVGGPVLTGLENPHPVTTVRRLEAELIAARMDAEQQALRIENLAKALLDAETKLKKVRQNVENAQNHYRTLHGTDELWDELGEVFDD